MPREGITIQLHVRAINVAADRVASVERMSDGKLPAEEVVP